MSHVKATVKHVRSKRYVTPDPVAIGEAIAGRRPRLWPSEICIVVQTLAERGWTTVCIAEHIGTCDRTVQRHRAHTYTSWGACQQLPQEDEDDGCCALEPGHEGVCAYICPECHGTTYCWACGGPSGDDLGTGCSECDGTGYCFHCTEGMITHD